MTSAASPHIDLRTRPLDAALAPIRRKGCQSTSVDEPCAATGLSKGSCFHRFKCKEDLGLAAVLHGGQTTCALFTQAALHGAFVVARAAGDVQAAAPLIAHLRAHVQGWLGYVPPAPTPRRRSKP